MTLQTTAVQSEIADMAEAAFGRLAGLPTMADAGIAAAMATEVEDLARLRQAGERQVAFSLALVGVAFLIAALAAWMLVRFVCRPVRRLSHAVGTLAGGGHDVEIPSRTRSDEIGQMARTVETLRRHAIETCALKATQDRTAGDAEQHRKEALLGVLHELVNVAVEGNEAMIAMARMQQAVAGTEEQVQSMASALEEMRASIAEISANGDRAIAEARTSETAASEGLRKADEASGSMNRIAATVDTAKAGVSELAEASTQIGAIVADIEAIAGQTNMLALNATIEAARAGAAGKGFAVVAAEVKALANQTGKATDDIRHRIETLRARMDTIIAAMEASADAVQSGRTVVGDLGGRLHVIAGNANTVTGKMTEISSILTQQTAAAEDLSKAAVRVSDIASSSTGEIRNAVGQIDRLSQALNRQLGSFADLGALATIEIARNDHTVFKKTVVQAILDRNLGAADSLPDHHGCALGRWCATADDLVRSQPAFARLEGPHRRVHAEGRRVLRLLAAHDVAAAIEAVGPLSAASDEVLGLLEELSQQMVAAGNTRSAA
ncbi:MAG: CZB domain-containing protein [Rhodospirillaceae bacterium]|nr:CZB domain-containing protein [Rhodospirillaceae bacterium]